MEDPKKRIGSIYKKVLKDHPEIVYNGVRKRKKRIIIGCTKVFLSVIACFLILFIFRQAAIPVIEKDNGLSAEELIKRYGEIFVFTVYSEADVWSKEVAESLSDSLNAIDHITSLSISDTEYTSSQRELLPGEKAPGQSLNGDKSNENGSCIAVRVGHTVMDTRPYLDEYHRIGGGYEIFHTDATVHEHETITLLAFGRDAAVKAADKFTDYFVKAGHFTRLFGKLYVSKPAVTEALPITVTARGEGTPSLLVISRPAADDESAAALEKLLDSAKPDLVVFNGGISCGEADRQGLEKAWSRISGLLDARNTAWCAVFSSADRGSMIPVSTVKEVVLSYGGPTSMISGSNGWIVFTDEAGVPVAATALFGLYEETFAPVTYMTTLKRAAMREIPVCTVLPGAPEEIMSSIIGNTKDPEFRFGLYEQPEEYLAQKFADVMTASFSLGVPCVIFGGNNNAGVFETFYRGLYGTTGFCANIDYTSYGLGGRYQLNNSLRGGMSVLLGDEPLLSYVRAAG